MRISGDLTQPSFSRHAEVKIPFQGEQYGHDNNIHISNAQDGILNQLVKEYNKNLEENGTAVKFSIHKETHSIVVKIVDAKTDEVIKEIPPEKIIDLIYNLCKNIGLIVDEKG